jgi:hypothetical protein
MKQDEATLNAKGQSNKNEDRHQSSKKKQHYEQATLAGGAIQEKRPGAAS